MNPVSRRHDLRVGENASIGNGSATHALQNIPTCSKPKPLSAQCYADCTACTIVYTPLLWRNIQKCSKIYAERQDTWLLVTLKLWISSKSLRMDHVQGFPHNIQLIDSLLTGYLQMRKKNWTLSYIVVTVRQIWKKIHHCTKRRVTK